MKTLIEYTIVAVPFHADAATHEELAQKVNEKLNIGYGLYGPPFFSKEMMYQAMTKPIPGKLGGERSKASQAHGNPVPI